MNSKYSIHGFSLQDTEKSKCGDAHIIKFIEEHNTLLFAVADGVGSHACDWKASDLACAYWIKEMEKGLSENTDIATAFTKSLKRTNHLIISESSPCEGMMTTFVAVVWDRKNEVFYQSYLGVSRLYILTDDKLKQLTKDQAESVIKKKGGNPLIIDGEAVVRLGLNNALGQHDARIDIEKITLSIPSQISEGVVFI